MADLLDTLQQAGGLTVLDVQFARALGRRRGAEENAQEVLLAAAVASHAAGMGHVCVDLASLCESATVWDDDGHPVPQVSWPPLATWRAALRGSPLVVDGKVANSWAPLVLDGADRLYLERLWSHEQSLASHIEKRAAMRDDIDPAWLRPALDRLFDAANDRNEPDWQRIAAHAALRSRFGVISGGPGTGKTFTVAKLLALMVERETHAGRPVPRIALLAPTGKAAARLSESIRGAIEQLDCDTATRAAIPTEASTIHRALRISPSIRSGRKRTLLSADTVLIDEASMVDLTLLRRLLDALEASTRVILLGDKDQLASVEAGAVLGDICNAGQELPVTTGLANALAESGTIAPAPSAEVDPPPLAESIVQLRRSYRYGERSGIRQLAEHVNGGDASGAVACMADARFPDVRLEPAGAVDEIVARVAGGVARRRSLDDPARRIDDLARFGVLCAHRQGTLGATGLNAAIQAAVADTEAFGEERLGPGQPVLITRNDYSVGVFNGDVGVVDNDGNGVWFRGPHGLRRIARSRLPNHEPAFALTVHKSQGSEYDEVFLILPEEISPVVTRELIYTAITRARSKVSLCGREEILRAAIARRTTRASGLRDRLWPAQHGESGSA